MINWEEIIRTESADELKEVKLWLFQENMRLQKEQRELENARDKFLKERVRLRDEVDELNRKTVMERKRLKEESMFFDKKMEILKAGFLQLEQDRKVLEQEKRNFEQEKLHLIQRESDVASSEEAVALLFRNANNPLALRKRYRDLIKIFHPDNLFGDAELTLSINKEFSKRREEQ
ncbi:MAG: hypothetical protein K6G30_06380 [Acetatifactor sp.]|nr:hypothetical protein [Acetatifactor sp.]